MVFRALILLGLLAALLCFVAYAWTGKLVWRNRGLRIAGTTIFAALAFFAVLFVQRLVEMM